MYYGTFEEFEQALLPYERDFYEHLLEEVEDKEKARKIFLDDESIWVDYQSLLSELKTVEGGLKGLEQDEDGEYNVDDVYEKGIENLEKRGYTIFHTPEHGGAIYAYKK